MNNNNAVEREIKKSTSYLKELIPTLKKYWRITLYVFDGSLPYSIDGYCLSATTSGNVTSHIVEFKHREKYNKDDYEDIMIEKVKIDEMYKHYKNAKITPFYIVLYYDALCLYQLDYLMEKYNELEYEQKYLPTNFTKSAYVWKNVIHVGNEHRYTITRIRKEERNEE